MPTISEFYGIRIRMFFAAGEHNPPHFHADYAGQEALFDIRTGSVLRGKLPPKALLLVKEWWIMHQPELMGIWESQNFRTIAPLE